MIDDDKDEEDEDEDEGGRDGEWDARANDDVYGDDNGG